MIGLLSQEQAYSFKSVRAVGAIENRRRKSQVQSAAEEVAYIQDNDRLSPRMESRVRSDCRKIGWSSPDLIIERIVEVGKAANDYSSIQSHPHGVDLLRYIKDVSKQQPHETYMTDRICSVDRSYIQLKNHGQEAYYVLDGKVQNGFRSRKSAGIREKSLDGLIPTSNGNIWVLNKFDNNRGGGQDDARDSIFRQIDAIAEVVNDDVFCFVCEGDYYSEAMLSRLRAAADGFSNIYVLSTDQFLNLLRRRETPAVAA
jgi:hypothetical protein